MDTILASSLANVDAAPLVISGIDPYDRSTHDLKTTCTALTKAQANPRIPRRSTERAQDALAHGCPH
jgi:hypothetical protein